ncbi:MAG TPA: hypothetical protein VFM82_12195 [Flavobacteriaceae bacterium]|nr:hypothetical protein [Flavobacteriaceae bacterium]
MTLQEVLDFVKANQGEIKPLLQNLQETEPGKEFLTDHANAHFEKEIKPRIAKVYSDIDNDVFEVIGERKPDDKKTYEFLKEKMRELKTLKESKEPNKVKELEAQIEALKKEGGNSDYWKKTHEEAVSKWDTTKQEYETKLSNLENQQKQGQIRSFLDTGLSGLEFSVPQEAVDALKQVHSTSVMDSAKIIDGKVVLHDKDGNQMLNSHYKPMTAEDFWKDKLQSVIKKPNTGGGGAPAGNKGDIITTGEGENAKSKLVVNGGFTTKRQFQDVAGKLLIEKGIERNSKEWNELMDGAYKDNEVSKMPIE